MPETIPSDRLKAIEIHLEQCLERHKDYIRWRTQVESDIIEMKKGIKKQGGGIKTIGKELKGLESIVTKGVTLI